MHDPWAAVCDNVTSGSAALIGSKARTKIKTVQPILSAGTTQKEEIPRNMDIFLCHHFIIFVVTHAIVEMKTSGSRSPDHPSLPGLKSKSKWFDPKWLKPTPD